MTSPSRKIKRKKKAAAQKELKKKISLFGRLGDECDACQKPFDKKCKEHAMTLNVVVRSKENIVRLYCPDCWDKARNLIKELENDSRVQAKTGR